MKTVIVTGATSLIGHFLLPRLANAGYRIIAISRSNNETWLQASDAHVLLQSDISSPDRLENSDLIAGADLLIHLAPLWLLPNFLERNSQLKNIRSIAFSSTSRLTKTSSSNLAERAVAENLARAETDLLAMCKAQITIFRPTLIYGEALDKNISTISRWISRYKFFPIIGKGSGLRQPVHADDLAKACLQAASHPQAKGNIYALVGGEKLTYRLMVERIFLSLKIKPRILSLPAGLVKILIRVISIFPKYQELTPEMAMRMNKHLVFDASSAYQDFGYRARDFYPQKSDLTQ